MNEKLRAYASRFASFLIEDLEKKISEVDNIILYGSVVQGTADKDSDVDIFIDTEADIEETVKEILDRFYESREYTLFKAKGVDNEISIKVGMLKEWKELHRSIVSTGKVLWGDFRAREKPVGTKHKVLFYWDKISRGRTSFLNKLYGFKTGEAKRKGLLEKWGGRKTGKSSVLIPYKYRDKMYELIEKYRVNAKSIELFEVD